MERENLSNRRVNQEARELMKMKTKKKLPELLKRSQEEGVLFIPPRTFLNHIKGIVKSDLESPERESRLSGKQIEKIAGALKKINASREVDDYLTVLKEFRKTDDPHLKELAGKGFPIELLNLEKLSGTQEEGNLKECMNLLLRHEKQFTEAHEGDVEHTAASLNELQERLKGIKRYYSSPYREREIIFGGVATFLNSLLPLAITVPFMAIPSLMLSAFVTPYTFYFNHMKRKVRKEPVLGNLTISKKVNLRDATTVLEELFRKPSHAYRHGKTEAIASSVLHLGVGKGESIKRYIPKMVQFWWNMGQANPEKIGLVHRLFDRLSEDTKEKIFSGERCEHFVDILTSTKGLYHHLDELRGTTPKKGYEHIENALGIPAELVDSIADVNPRFLQSELERAKGRLENYGGLRDIGKFQDRTEQGIELSFRDFREGDRDEPGDEASPRLEKFEEGANVYSVPYPKHYWDLAIQVAMRLNDLDEERFGPVIRRIRDKVSGRSAPLMLLSACVAEKDPEKLEAMRRAVRTGTTPGLRYRVTKERTLEPYSSEIGEEPARRMIAHKVFTPDKKATHYDVIQKVLEEEFGRDGKKTKELHNLQNHVEHLAAAEKIIESKIGK